MNSVMPIESLTLKTFQSRDHDWLRRGELVLDNHVNDRVPAVAGNPNTGAAMVCGDDLDAAPLVYGEPLFGVRMLTWIVAFHSSVHPSRAAVSRATLQYDDYRRA